jgi:hypothetical protein
MSAEQCNELFKARFKSVWKLHGASKLLPTTDPLELIRTQKPTFLARLTADPEVDLERIDEAGALGVLILKGLFAPESEGSLDERLNTEVEAIKSRRLKQYRGGVFLILEAEAEILAPNFDTKRNTEKFDISFDAIDKREFRTIFDPLVKASLTAMCLALPANADRRVENVGEIIYLVNPGSEKPIYTFTIKGGAIGVSIGSPLADDHLAEAAVLVPKLLENREVSKASSLILSSLNKATDQLQAFIAAWSALEIFINATFKSAYQTQWIRILEIGAPAAVRPVIDRLADVLADKYRLTDKFLIVAAVLDAEGAAEDSEAFQRLKLVRDKLFHALEMPAQLPTEEVQKLVLKFLKLHLAAI